MKKILFILLLLVFVSKVNALETKYFKIDIPEDYEETKTDEFNYKWSSKTNSHENLILSISSNTGTKKQDVKKYNEEDIKTYAKYIEEELEEQLKEYNLKVEVRNVKKEQVNNRYALSYETFWPTKESISYDIYQKGYSFTTENYIYVFTFTSDNIIESNSNYKKAINSLELLDDDIKSTGFLNERWKQVALVSVIAGIIGYIVSAIKKRN